MLARFGCVSMRKKRSIEVKVTGQEDCATGGM